MTKIMTINEFNMFSKKNITTKLNISKSIFTKGSPLFIGDPKVIITNDDYFNEIKRNNIVNIKLGEITVGVVFKVSNNCKKFRDLDNNIYDIKSGYIGILNAEELCEYFYVGMYELNDKMLVDIVNNTKGKGVLLNSNSSYGSYDMVISCEDSLITIKLNNQDISKIELLDGDGSRCDDASIEFGIIKDYYLDQEEI